MLNSYIKNHSPWNLVGRLSIEPLKDRYSCLSSKDGSDTTDIYGLKAEVIHAWLVIRRWKINARCSHGLPAAVRSRVSLAFGVVARAKLTVVESVHDPGENGQMMEKL